MQLVSIFIELGEALRSDELITLERTEAMIEQVVAVSLQAHFTLVVVKHIRLGSTYVDELSNDGTSFLNE